MAASEYAAPMGDHIDVEDFKSTLNHSKDRPMVRLRVACNECRKRKVCRR